MGSRVIPSLMVKMKVSSIRNTHCWREEGRVVWRVSVVVVREGRRGVAQKVATSVVCGVVVRQPCFWSGVMEGVLVVRFACFWFQMWQTGLSHFKSGSFPRTSAVTSGVTLVVILGLGVIVCDNPSLFRLSSATVEKRSALYVLFFFFLLPLFCFSVAPTHPHQGTNWWKAVSSVCVEYACCVMCVVVVSLSCCCGGVLCCVRALC